MSGVVKGVKKTFKKVTKFIKRYGTSILAAGAIFFTAGGALSAFAGGAGAWGQAIGSLGSGTLGSVLGGAVTQAGYGAAIGGIISKAQGGSFRSGANAGAAVGAVTGGISGYMSTPTVGQSSVLAPDTGTQYSGLDNSLATSQTVGSGDIVQSAIDGNVAMTTTPYNVPQQGLLSGLKQAGSGLLQYAENNPTLTGHVVAGVGNYLAADAQADSERELLDRRRQQIADSYKGVDVMSGYRSFARPQQGLIQPRARFTPQHDDWEFQFDPSQGRIVRTPLRG